MATFDLGRVTPIYRREYSATASYELNDVVLYEGNLYWHVQATATVGIAPTDTTVWKLAFSDEGVRAEIRGYADDAQASADSALASKSAAATSASNASASASQAALSAQTASTKASEASASAQTASTKASEASTSAQSAASSAQTATDKATLASQKAAAASESASLATAKASAAATSETNAAASAQTASAKASEAAASATSAQEYDESAQQSAVNAQTAQGLAETAQTAAETAQGLAEDARDLAQQYAESIDPEHIFSAYPTDTASGAIASFADGADDIPLKSLVVDINPVQSGSGDPSPDNVRPISGWTGANVARTGINQWDEETFSSGVCLNSAGTDVSSNVSYATLGTIASKIRVLPNHEYAVSVGGALSSKYYAIFDESGVIIGARSYANASTPIVIPDNGRYMRVSVPYASATYNHDISINYPSNDHDYHAYTGQTLPISWQTEAGTVYGGSLDVLTGVLTVDRAMATFDGSSDEQWSLQSINSYGIANFFVSIPHFPEINYKSACSMLAPQTSSIANTSTEGYFIHPNGAYIYIRVSTDRASTVDEWGAWLTQNNIQLVYSLAEAIEIQLSPNQINSLYGQNNIFADTGDSAVEYRADTKMYIERLTEPDADMIADANITSGSYFMVGNTLYKATANIASGSAVIVGTNCTQKSLSEALNEINQ